MGFKYQTPEIWIHLKTEDLSQPFETPDKGVPFMAYLYNFGLIFEKFLENLIIVDAILECHSKIKSFSNRTAFGYLNTSTIWVVRYSDGHCALLLMLSSTVPLDFVSLRIPGKIVSTAQTIL